MAAAKFTVPNWAQSLIAKAAQLDVDSLSVRVDDDRSIVFLDHKTRKEYIVRKHDGHVIPI